MFLLGQSGFNGEWTSGESMVLWYREGGMDLLSKGPLRKVHLR